MNQKESTVEPRTMRPACDLNILVRDLCDQERHAYETWARRGHTYFGDKQSEARYKDTFQLLREAVTAAITFLGDDFNPEVSA